jgi:hypothetical protein
MKYLYILTFLVLLMSHTVTARVSKPSSGLALSYDDVNTGRNLNLAVHYPFSRTWNIYGGLKYLINSPYYKNDYSLRTSYFKEFYTHSFSEHWGAKAGLEKTLLQLNTNSSFFAFYDFQFTAASILNVNKTFYSDTNVYQELHNLPIKVYENVLGVGMRFTVSENFVFCLQGGVGVNFYRRRGTSMPPIDPGYNWNRTRMFAFGLRYNLDKQVKNKNKSVRKKEKEVLISHNYLSIHYDDIQTGRNFNINYGCGLGVHTQIYAGLKYGINSKLYVDYTRMEESYYFKQFRSSNLTQHLGLKFGVEQHYTVPKSNIQLFGFYDVQVMRCDVKSLAALATFSSGESRADGIGGSQTPEEKYYAMFKTYGPVTALENYIGAGVKMAITPEINFRVQGGVGYNFYFGPDHYNPYDVLYEPFHYENKPWTAQKSEISRMFSLGLEYKLGKKSK